MVQTYTFTDQILVERSVEITTGFRQKTKKKGAAWESSTAEGKDVQGRPWAKGRSDEHYTGHLFFFKIFCFLRVNAVITISLYYTGHQCLDCGDSPWLEMQEHAKNKRS